MAKPSLKNLPNVSNEPRNGEEIKKRLQEGAKDYASLKVEKKPEGKARKKSSLSMPEYCLGFVMGGNQREQRAAKCHCDARFESHWLRYRRSGFG